MAGELSNGSFVLDGLGKSAHLLDIDFHAAQTLVRFLVALLGVAQMLADYAEIVREVVQLLVDKDNKWRGVNFFDTKKLRKKWQYHLIMALKKAVKGTDYEEEWYEKLGAMFKQYPSGFDCDCPQDPMDMPEERPVDRLVVYLCKYVSSPPISIRRIENYDGQNVAYRYEDHRKGLVHETLSATDFIERMVQHLPPKGFRMVRYYGIYARPVRDKIHKMVALVLSATADPPLEEKNWQGQQRKWLSTLRRSVG